MIHRQVIKQNLWLARLCFLPTGETSFLAETVTASVPLKRPQMSQRMRGGRNTMIPTTIFE